MAGDRLVVTWTDWRNEDATGVWLLLLTARFLHRVCGPVRVGDTEQGPVPRAVSAPHPEGLVVIWARDGAAPSGVYGKIVSVEPAGAHP